MPPLNQRGVPEAVRWRSWGEQIVKFGVGVGGEVESGWSSEDVMRSRVSFSCAFSCSEFEVGGSSGLGLTFPMVPASPEWKEYSVSPTSSQPIQKVSLSPGEVVSKLVPKLVMLE